MAIETRMITYRLSMPLEEKNILKTASALLPSW